MINLLSEVTPHTKGLLWFTKDPITSDQGYYKDVDYLVNGLLTATLKDSAPHMCHVLVTENFGHSFYVLVSSAFLKNEIMSYFDLLNGQMTGEGHLLLIDEAGVFSKIQQIAPPELKSKIQVTL